MHAALVNAWEVNGRRFEVVMASDVIRDGMALELTDLDQATMKGPALEIFWSDVDQTLTFSALHAVDVPMAILSRFVETAVRDLPPTH